MELVAAATRIASGKCEMKMKIESSGLKWSWLECNALRKLVTNEAHSIILMATASCLANSKHLEALRPIWMVLPPGCISLNCPALVRVYLHLSPSPPCQPYPFHFQLASGQFNAFSACLVYLMRLRLLLLFYFYLVFLLRNFIYYGALQGKTFAACNFCRISCPLTQT